MTGKQDSNRNKKAGFTPAFCIALRASAQVALARQLEQDLLHRLVDAQAGGVDRQLGFFRHFVNGKMEIVEIGSDTIYRLIIK